MASQKLSRYNFSGNKSHHGDSTIDTGAQKEHLVYDPDLLFENHFSLFLIRPVSTAGKAWLYANIANDGQTLGEAIVCEPRYVENIFHGATADGLVCR